MSDLGCDGFVRCRSHGWLGLCSLRRRNMMTYGHVHRSVFSLEVFLPHLFLDRPWWTSFLMDLTWGRITLLVAPILNCRTPVESAWIAREVSRIFIGLIHTSCPWISHLIPIFVNELCGLDWWGNFNECILGLRMLLHSIFSYISVRFHTPYHLGLILCTSP